VKPAIVSEIVVGQNHRFGGLSENFGLQIQQSGRESARTTQVDAELSKPGAETFNRLACNDLAGTPFA
tara:strand:- start:262476 stop:262679 length:204 start_codon:yes stop_codon:yes gene_type:complete